MKFRFSKTEIIHLILSAMLITFLVSFNIKSEVSAVIRIALVSTISLIFAVIIQKLVGLKYGLEAEYRIWAFREYTKPPKSFLRAIEDFFYDYTGILIPLAVFLLTNAFWPFLAIASFIIKRPLKIRTGRFPFIKEKEVSAVAFFGVLSYLFVGLILNMFAPSGLIETKIPFLLALYSLIPLPNLPGSKIFFGGRITYIFTLAVTLSLFVLIPLLSVSYSLIISIAFALILAGVYFYGMESGIKNPFSLERPSIEIGWKFLFVMILISLIFLFLYFTNVNIITVISLAIVITTLAIVLYYYLIGTKK